MDLADYCRQAPGGQTDLGRALGCPPQLVSQWCRKVRPVPLDRCPDIERATSGAVTRRDLRPDDWHRIWPELVNDEHPAPEEARSAA
ncbi:MAG: helix-turn-helix domain-containing protein [Burkholderiaceae bacterium]|jgi:DNA-binding transcriptional regulator YdaS (Cro superfamily)|nr:helix-turn-helix domain-containing protein [Burkholderiaceae bacterium]MCU0964064.1 helix-turn-helix domain-containing protein [Burkholderiaceae bacterium]